LSGLAVLSGCGGAGHARGGPATTLLARDDWTAPSVTGPPSAANFCTVLTAMYRHESELPIATQKIKEQIVRDFVATVPEALAAAPAPIAPAAHTYLVSLAAVLRALDQAGLDYRRIPAGTLTPLLLDPNVKTAGNQVLAYSQTVCHYTIGGSPT
jgi:hypothetical protein